jgi:myo-inositol 2-dehydrogenase / D-chiro-inositol 1-dehydrogenase
LPQHKSEKAGENRREFLTASATSVGLLLVPPATAFGTQANSAVELGMIGAGGRGNWVGNFFVEQAGGRFTALADAFVDRLETAGAKFGVPPNRRYRGLEAYKELLASKLDGVVIETPAYFHPEHAAAAVAAGKHVFIAKPVAVDVPGCRSIIESGERAKGKVTFLVDFQTRAQPAFQEAAARVHRGDIGTPVMGHIYYHGSGGDPKPRPGWSRDEARLRMWSRDRVLSGDIIVEQNVHVIDMGNWFLQGHPVKASGMCSRRVRLNYGDCNDLFVVQFEYPRNITADFSSVQFIRGYYDICARIYGTQGTLDSHYGLGPRFQVDPRLDGSIAITGDKPWKGADRDKTFDDGALANAKSFVQSIRTGKLLNNALESAESTLTCVLARTAAYRGGTVTWDEMMDLNVKLDARLSL